MKTILVILAMVLSLSASSQTLWDRYIHSFTLVATDPDLGDDERYWLIATGNVTNPDNTGKVFLIKPCSGEVIVDTLVYTTFTSSRTFNLVMKCTDKSGAASTTKRKVVLRKSGGKRVQSIITTMP